MDIVPRRRGNLNSQFEDGGRSEITAELRSPVAQSLSITRESSSGGSDEGITEEMGIASGASCVSCARSSQNGQNGKLRPDRSPSQISGAVRVSEDQAQADSSSGSDARDVCRVEAVSVDDAIKRGYPDLNFRFATLKTWFLIVTITLWLVIIGTIIALVRIQLSQPGVLHVRETGNYYAIRYGPGLVGTVTSIWRKSIVQSYNRLFPYVVMANQPMLEKDGVEVVAAHRLNNISGDTIDTNGMMQLAKGRHWTAIAVSVFGVGIPLILVAIKSGLLQITEDQAGWGITVDPKIGYAIIALYSTLCLTSLAVLIQLWDRNTGLK